MIRVEVGSKKVLEKSSVTRIPFQMADMYLVLHRAHMNEFRAYQSSAVYYESFSRNFHTASATTALLHDITFYIVDGLSCL